MNTENVEKIIKCRDDIFSFLKYVKYHHFDKGLVNYIPYDFQKDIIKFVDNNRFCLLNCARQLGKTSTISIYLLWYAMFNSNRTIGIFSNKLSNGASTLRFIKRIFDELPDWLKPDIIISNKNRIEFDNGSVIMVGAVNESSCRGMTFNIVFCDEFAFVRPKQRAYDFYKCVLPVITSSKKSKMIIMSTPNGTDNLFYDLYTEPNTFNKFIADWTAHPDRDEEWAEEQKIYIGHDRFRQEHEAMFIESR